MALAFLLLRRLRYRHVFLNQRQGALASTADGDAIAMVEAAASVTGLPSRPNFIDGSRDAELEDLNFSIRMGLDSLSAQAMPPIRLRRDGTTTASRSGAVRGVPARWCLARDDGIVIEGMHEGEVLGLAARRDSSYASS